MRRLVGALGILAALSVLGAAMTAALDRPASRATDARQWLRAYGVEVAVPVTRWRLADPSEAIRYGDTATVRAPAVLDEGFCPSSHSSSRAFVGMLPARAGAIADVLSRQLAGWASAIRGEAVPTPTVTGTRADLDVPVPPGPCAPTTVHLTLVATPTAQGVVTLVLVRDVGEPGDLSATAADAIVQSLRSRT